jgi:PAS domain-containing protein
MNMQINSTVANNNSDSVCVMQPIPGEVQPEQLHEAAIALDEDGYIRACDTGVEKLTGYSRRELLWQHISCLFPKLTDVVLMHGNRLNPLLNYFGRSDQQTKRNHHLQFEFPDDRTRRHAKYQTDRTPG